MYLFRLPYRVFGLGDEDVQELIDGWQKQTEENFSHDHLPTLTHYVVDTWYAIRAM